MPPVLGDTVISCYHILSTNKPCYLPDHMRLWSMMYSEQSAYRSSTPTPKTIGDSPRTASYATNVEAAAGTARSNDGLMPLNNADLLDQYLLPSVLTRPPSPSISPHDMV
jgi:hypothetical protein